MRLSGNLSLCRSMLVSAEAMSLSSRTCPGAPAQVGQVRQAQLGQVQQAQLDQQVAPAIAV
jgi:hypothetical protein